MVNIYRSRVTISGGIAGAGVSTMYWGSTVTDDDYSGIAGKLNGLWTQVGVMAASACNYTLDPELEEVDPATGHLVDVHPLTTWTITGSGGTEPLPWATQLLLRFRTGITMGDPAREIRGRCFVPGICEDRSSVGRPSGTLISAFNSALATFIAADPEATNLVYSKANFTPALVTSATVWGEWASLRSRRD